MWEAEENLKQPPLINILLGKENITSFIQRRFIGQLININFILISESAEIWKGYKNSCLHVVYSPVYNAFMKLEQNIWGIIT